MKHLCHWKGCKREVPPHMWGCKYHWSLLPLRLRTRLWKAYVPGQEARKDPSPEYIAITIEIDKWIKECGQL